MGYRPVQAAPSLIVEVLNVNIVHPMH